VVTRRVEDFYAEKKTLPSCKKLLPVIKEKLNASWGKQSLRRLVHKIGFRWQKCQK
jgi:transposase